MRRFIFALVTFSLLATMAFAQSTTGRLLGTVSSPDGLLPGATIEITDNQTGRVQTTTSRDNGAYRFERVPFGTYTVKVTSAGFKTYVSPDVKVDANQDYTLNPVLEVGDISVVVTVESGADLVNSQTGELSNTVSAQQVLDLPIDGRNPLSLVSLQAGANATAANHINGQRTSSTNFTRDGINVQDQFIRTGAFVQDRPSVDDTGEFTVVTQNAGAELGGGGSAQIQLVTPRGGSEFTGAAYLYNRNSEFAANSFINNATGVDRAFLNRNQFGGRVSGPFPLPGFGSGSPSYWKDKMFFFVNYERFLLRQQSSNSTTILRPQFRDGTFTYIGTDNNEYTVNVLTGAGLTAPIPAINGGVLGVDPTIQTRVLDRVPTVGNGLLGTGSVVPNADGSCPTCLTQGFTFNQRNNDTRDAVTTRFDYEVNDSNQFYFVYKYNKNSDDRTDIDGTFNVVPVNDQGGPTQGYLLAYNGVIGSNFSTEIRGAYNQSDPFFNRDPNFPTDFLVGGLSFLTNPQSTFQAQGRKTDQYTFQNNNSYTWNSHTFQFGGDLNVQRLDTETNFGQVGTYNITTPANPNTPGLDASLFPGGISTVLRGRADALRNMLGGVVGSGSISAQFVNAQVGPQLGASNRERFEWEQWALYLNDSWRVNSELTLNLGVRWDYFTPLQNPDVVYLEPDLEGATTRDQIRTNLLDPTGQYVLLGTNTGTPGQFTNPDKNNFGPILSFAWSPQDRGGIIGALFGESGALRGGFRLGYVNDEYVRGPDNAAGGNVGLDLTGLALNPNDGSVNLNTTFQNLPGFTLPTFQNPPISFATGNANNGSFFNTVFTADPQLEMQRNMQYNFGFQREIGWDSAVEIRYVGGRSDNMVRAFDFNQVDINTAGFLNDFLTARNNCRIAIADFNAMNPANPRFMDGGCSAAEMAGTGLPGQGTVGPTMLLGAGIVRDYIQRGIVGQLAFLYLTNGLGSTPAGGPNSGFGGTQFRQNFAAGVVDLLANDGKYRYDAMQIEFRRRFTDGVAFQANYTFAKNLSDIDNDNQSRFRPFLDNAQPELEYARTNYDRTHTINFNGLYELPFGDGKKFLNNGGIVNKVFGGWMMTSIVQISSGVPLSIKDFNGTLNRSGRSFNQTANTSLTADQIRDLLGIREVNGITYFIDPSIIGPNGSATNGNLEATADSRFNGQVFFRAQPGQTGTLGRNFLDGPWFYNWDAGLIKNTRFGERFNVQFRAEAFNVLNKTNYFIGEGSNIFDVDSTGFGRLTNSTYGPRIMQFAVRLEF